MLPILPPINLVSLNITLIFILCFKYALDLQSWKRRRSSTWPSRTSPPQVLDKGVPTFSAAWCATNGDAASVALCNRSSPFA